MLLQAACSVHLLGTSPADNVLSQPTKRDPQSSSNLSLQSHVVVMQGAGHTLAGCAEPSACSVVVISVGSYVPWQGVMLHVIGARMQICWQR
jgi:hypothetical protein